MFHDATPSERNMSDDTRRAVPPLTSRTEGGKLYTRFADVEAEIGDVWPRPPAHWIALKKKLKNETVVFLIKKGGVKDDQIRGELQAELNVRTIRIAKGGMKGFDYVLKEEMALEVEAQVFSLVWPDANCAQAEYLEVNFAGKVRDLSRNVIERYKHSVVAKRDQLDVWTGAEAEGEYDVVELRRDVADVRRNSEEILLLIEDDSRQDELLQFIRDSVKDPRHFLALYLFHAEDKSLAQIAAQFKTKVRQIRDWKDTAMHQIRVALGLESEEKREALRKQRNARRAARRAESRKIRPSSQSPSIFL
jgi:hypothetical protein